MKVEQAAQHFSGQRILEPGKFVVRPQDDAILRSRRALMKADRPGEVVYFIRAANSPLIKIGKTSDLPRRLNAMQACNPAELKVLATTPGYTVLESSIHRRFASSRRHGEWFEPTSELMALIADNQPSE